MVESLVVAAVLVIAAWVLLPWLARTLGGAAIPNGLAGDGAPERPAMVNLVLTNCRPGAAAYQATILDLAARGFLTASNDHGRLLVALAQPPSGAPVPAGYEQQVLGDTRARLADTSAAPFAALAAACAADVRGTWDPFEQKLLTEARSSGICRQPLPATGRTAGLALAATAAIAAVTSLMAWPRPAGAADGPVFTPLVVVIVLWCGLGWLERQDRLTAAGSALATGWKRERPGITAAGAWDDVAPASLGRRAFEVAAGIQRAAPDSPVAGSRRAHRLRAARPVSTQRPGDAWSSFSGTWRPVTTGPGEGMGMGAGVAMLVGAAWLGVIAYILHIAVATGPLPLIPVAAAILLATGGLRRLIRLSALPGRAAFDGQVIARWEEESSSENGSSTEWHISVDDGQRGWTFTGQATYNRVTLGDLVRVTVNPRSRRLIELTVTGRPRTQPTAGAPGTGPTAAQAAPPRGEPLLTSADVTALLGPGVRTLPLPSLSGRGVVHKGRAASLAVMVVGGRVADLNLGAARKRGVPLPGLGDEAWLMTGERAVVVRAGAQTAKLIMSGAADPQDEDLLRTLAATVAARIAAQPSRNV